MKCHFIMAFFVFFLGFSAVLAEDSLPLISSGSKVVRGSDGPLIYALCDSDEKAEKVIFQVEGAAIRRLEPQGKLAVALLSDVEEGIQEVAVEASLNDRERATLKLPVMEAVPIKPQFEELLASQTSQMKFLVSKAPANLSFRVSEGTWVFQQNAVSVTVAPSPKPRYVVCEALLDGQVVGRAHVALKGKTRFQGLTDAGALVRVVAQETVLAESRSDDQGQFDLSILVHPKQDLSDLKVVIADPAGNVTERKSPLSQEPFHVTWSLFPQAVIADGQSRALIRAEIADLKGVPITGASVRLSVEGGASGPFREYLPGSYESWVQGPAKFVPKLTGQLIVNHPDHRTLNQALKLPMRAGAPSRITMSLSQTTVRGDGRSTVEIAAKVVDAGGNPCERVNLEFEASAGSISSVKEIGNGNYQATYTSPATLEKVAVTLKARVRPAPARREGSWSVLVADRDQFRVHVFGANGLPLANESMEITQLTSQGVQTKLYQTNSSGQIALPKDLSFFNLITQTNYEVISHVGALGTLGEQDWIKTTVAQLETLSQVELSSGELELDVLAASEADLATIPQNLSLTVSQTSLPGDGQSQAQVTATIVDSQGEGVTGLQVTGQASLGTLSGFVESGSGIYVATFTAPQSAGATTVSLVAESSGLKGTASVSLVASGVPSAMTLSVDATSLVVGQAFVATTSIQDGLGAAVPDGTPVEFVFDGTTIATTTSGGVATANLVAPPTAGTYSVSASCQSVQQTVSVAVLGGTPNSLTVALDRSTARVDDALPISATVTVLDAQSSPVTDGTEVTVTLGSNSSKGTTSGGVAVITVAVPSVPGSYSVTATADSANGSAPLTVQAGLPATLTLTADLSTVQVTGNVTLTATVTDSLGNLVEDGTTVVVTSSLGTAPSGVTASGQATLIFTAGSSVGSGAITATATAATANVPLTVTAGDPSTLELSLGQSSVMADGVSTVNVDVLVKDSFSNPVEGIDIDFEKTKTMGSFSKTTDQTDASGEVKITYTAGTLTQTQEIKALVKNNTSINETEILMETNGINDANVMITAIDITPTLVSRGQNNVAVKVSVMNPGLTTAEIAAGGVSLNFNGGSLNSNYTVPTSAVTSISGGTTVDFNFLVDVSATATLGLVSITATVNGTDQITSAAISDVTASQSDSWTVQTAADIVINSVTTTPTLVSRGQSSITVTVNVTNNNQASAVFATGGIVLKFANGGDVSSEYTVPASSAQTILGGASQNFSLTVTVSGTATLGATTITATATATDINSGDTVQDITESQSDSWTVQTPATLVVNSITTTPTTVSRGQAAVAVTVNVSNTGQATAVVAMSGIDLNFVNGANVDSDYTIPASSAQNITGGNNHNFVFSITVGGAATLGATTITATAAGTDQNSGTAISDTTESQSDSWTVQTPATLVVNSVSTTPTTVSRGQSGISVTVNVGNTGQATAVVAMSGIDLNFVNGVNVDSDYTIPASSAQNITGGGSHNFVFSITVGGAATLGATTITATASGTDQNSGTAISDTTESQSDSWTVQTPATLVVNSVSTTPTTVSRGQSGISVTVNVGNTGQATAVVAMSGIDLNFVNGGNVDSDYTIPASSAQNITGGGSHNFVFSITVGAAATLGATTITATASGTDQNSSTAISDTTESQSDSWTVQTPATLVVSSVSTSPGNVSQGQTGISLTVNVQNTGQATAVVASGGITLKFSNGGNVTSEYTVTTSTAQNISGGGNQNFTFTISVGGAATTGTTTITSVANGTDQNTSSAISDTSESQNDSWNTQTPANISVVSVTTTPTTVYQNQQDVLVTVNVQNTGQARANLNSGDVTLNFKQGGTNENSDYTVPSSSGTNINGGSNVDYTFRVDISSTATLGAITITAIANATDNNSGSAVSDTSESVSDSWTVNSPGGAAVLQVASLTAVLTRVSQNQTGATVTIVVNNTGSNTANYNAGDFSLVFTNGGNDSGNYTVTTTPSAGGSITGGSFANFTFTVTVGAAAATGTTTITATTSGTDATTMLAIGDSTQSENDTWLVQTPANVVVNSVTTAPTTVSQGQSGITVTVNVSNTGQATAVVGGGAVDLNFTNGGNVNADYTIPASSAQNISGGNNQNYTFNITVGGAATLGATTITATASGTDVNSAAPTSDTTESVNDSWTVQTPATVSITSVAAAPAIVNQGQTGVSITVAISNSGQATAVVASGGVTLKFNNGGDVTSEYTVSTSTAQNITGGGSQNYVFTVDVDAGATLGVTTITSVVNATDQNSSSAISDTTEAQSDTWTVANCLSAQFAITQVTTSVTQVSENQTGIPVFVTLENEGDLGLHNLSINLAFDAAGYTATAHSGNPNTLAAGSTATFLYEVSVAGNVAPGIVTISANGTGQDVMTTQTFNDDTSGTSKVDTWTAYDQCVLSLDTVLPAAGAAKQGETGVSMSFTASNIGGADAAPFNVSAATLHFYKNADSSLKDSSFVVTPSLANPTSIAGGQVATFSFTVNVSAGAEKTLYDITAEISGSDAYSNIVLTDTTPTTSGAITVSKATGADKPRFYLNNVTATIGGTTWHTTESGVRVQFNATNVGDADVTAGWDAHGLHFYDASHVDQAAYFTITDGGRVIGDPGLPQLLEGATGTFWETFDVSASCPPGIYTVHPFLEAQGIRQDVAENPLIIEVFPYDPGSQSHFEILTVSTTPTEVILGDTSVAVSFTARNTGTSQALNNLVADLAFKTVSGSVDVSSEYTVTASLANPISIGPSLTETFSFTVTVVGDGAGAITAGAIQIDGTISGQESVSLTSRSDVSAETKDQWNANDDIVFGTGGP